MDYRWNIMNRKSNYHSIDLLKLIMAFIVIAIHTQPLYNVGNENIIKIYTIFTQYAVPFFFLSSGFLIGIKLEQPLDSEKNIVNIKKQLKKIVKLYVIWTLVYSPLAIYEYISNGTPFMQACLLYIKGLVFVGEHYNSWHLWYLLSTVYSFVMIVFLIKRKFSLKQILLISGFTSLISITCTQLVEYPYELPQNLYMINRIIRGTIINGRILLGMVYIPLGIYLSQKTFSKHINWIGLILGLVLMYIINNKIVSYYLLIISSVALFGIVKDMNLKERKFYQFARKASMIVYLIHMYIWTFYYVLIYGERKVGFDSFIATSLISVLITGTYIFLKDKHKLNHNKLIT